MRLLPKSIHWCRRYPTKFNSGRDIPQQTDASVADSAPRVPALDFSGAPTSQQVAPDAFMISFSFFIGSSQSFNGCRSYIYNGVNNLQAHYRWYVTDCF